MALMTWPSLYIAELAAMATTAGADQGSLGFAQKLTILRSLFKAEPPALALPRSRDDGRTRDEDESDGRCVPLFAYSEVQGLNARNLFLGKSFSAASKQA
jgi:hypothetical protein